MRCRKGSDDRFIYQPCWISLITEGAPDKPIISNTKFQSDWINGKIQHEEVDSIGKERGRKKRSPFSWFLSRRKRLQTSWDRNKVCLCVCSLTPAGWSYRSGLGPSGHWPQTAKKTRKTPPDDMSPEILSSKKRERLLEGFSGVTMVWMSHLHCDHRKQSKAEIFQPVSQQWFLSFASHCRDEQEAVTHSTTGSVRETQKQTNVCVNADPVLRWPLAIISKC